jgi:riboflavin kinase/FMN adenylyltransferase
MELIRSLHNLKPHHQGCVATIGNFDGVHLGHQQLLKDLKDAGQQHKLPSCLITFDPLPHEFFSPTSSLQARLTHFREKIHAIEQHTAPDRILLLRFNQQLANLDASTFIQQLLVKSLGIKHLIVGDDFRFGRQRCGSFQTLVEAQQRYGFTVSPTETYCIDNQRVSSTRIRKHLLAGQLDQAALLLGRAYAMEGRVVYGKQLGRTLGYPTANILLKRKKTPLHGVFVVNVINESGESFKGMASVGERPTVGGKETLLEVHLFDLNKNLYGQHLKTVFLHKIREEKKFSSLDELKAAIHLDELTARRWFKTH